MANNSKLTVLDMKEMINIFISNKLNVLKVGDFEISKSHYELPPSDNKASIEDDPLFYSGAQQLPPEVLGELSRMMKQGK